jgi:enoyl-[acyl-carrier protein] reductase I
LSEFGSAKDLLAGKTILVTGVLSDQSIAFEVARYAQNQGATVILTSFGRVMSLTARTAKRLPVEPVTVECDVTNEADLSGLAERVGEHTKQLDGLVHAIGFAPPDALGGDFVSVSWQSASTALQVSAYSLAALTNSLRPLMPSGSAIVGLDFDATKSWPVYDWMGVAKAAFESTARYLARHLGPQGIRVNLVAAGPLKTMAAKSIPGFEMFEEVWATRAPLGWDVNERVSTAKACVALLSDLFPATTGEIVHVDGGFHSTGA